MKFDLNFNNGIPIYIQLKEQIKYGVARGHLFPGTQLPTVRQLAVDLRINAELILKALELKYSPEELNRLMQKWVNRIDDKYCYIKIITKNGRLTVYE